MGSWAAGTREFLSRTTVHGCQYLAGGNNFAERGFWAALVLAGFAYSSYSIAETFIDWEARPTETTVETISMPVVRAPFPAVTVCPDQSDLDRWQYAESVLNLVDYDERSETDFGALVGAVARDIMGAVQKIRPSLPCEGNGTCPVEEVLKRCMANESCLELMAQLGSDGQAKSYLNELEGIAVASFGKYVFDEENVMLDAVASVINPEAKRRGLLKSGTTFDYESCLGEPGCRGNLEEFGGVLLGSLEFLFLDHGGLGTLLRNFAYLLGPVDNEQTMRTLDGILADLAGDRAGAVTDAYKGINVNDMTALLGGFPVTMELKGAGEFVYEDVLGKLFSFGDRGGLDDCVLVGNGRVNVSLADLWKEFFDGGSNGTVPCADNSSGDCCERFAKIFTADNLSVFFELAKFGLHIPYPGLGPHEAVEIGDVTPLLPSETALKGLAKKYNIATTSIEETLERLRKQDATEPLTERSELEQKLAWHRRFVPLCSFGTADILMGKCKRFRPAFTNYGLCYSFNLDSPATMFKEEVLSAIPDIMTDHKGGELFHPQGHGPQFQFQVVLDSHGRDADLLSTGGAGGRPFAVSVGSPPSVPDMRGGYVVLQPGHEVSLRVSLQGLEADSNLRHLSPDNRMCLFQDESDSLRIFKTYTRSNCMFECAMDRAEERCGCRPWDYPGHRVGGGRRVCDIFGSTCFDRALNAEDAQKGCECLTDCEEIRYTMNIYQTKLDAGPVCQMKTANLALYNYVVGETSLVESKRFMARYKQLKDNATKEYDDVQDYFLREVCPDKVENDLTVVNVVLESPTYTSMVHSERITFAGQLASLGGTLGLFTGMSILSIFEVGFWLVKIIFFAREKKLDKACPIINS